MFNWCTGEIESGDTLGQIYTTVSPPMSLTEVMQMIGEQNIGHPIYGEGIGDYNIRFFANEPLDSNWPPINIHPIMLAYAEINLGMTCQSEITFDPVTIPNTSSQINPSHFSLCGVLPEVISEVSSLFEPLISCNIPTSGSNIERTQTILLTEMRRFFENDIIDSADAQGHLNQLIYLSLIRSNCTYCDALSYPVFARACSFLDESMPPIAESYADLGANFPDTYCIIGNDFANEISGPSQLAYANAYLAILYDELKNFLNGNIEPSCEFQRTVRLIYGHAKNQLNNIIAMRQNR